VAQMARDRASTLGYDATRWHRIELRAKDVILRRAAEKRALEQRATVEIPREVPELAPGEADDEPLDERME